MGMYEGLALELKDQVIAALKQALAEKDREIAHLKEIVAHYDRWLSKGVYYTNEEFFEKILNPKQQLMREAFRFAIALVGNIANKDEIEKEAIEFLDSPEAEVWKEHP